MKIADNCCKDGFYYAEKAALGNAIRAARIKIGDLQNAARETKRGGTEKTRGELLRAESFCLAQSCRCLDPKALDETLVRNLPQMLGEPASGAALEPIEET